MGLSVAIAGGIVLTVMIFVMMSIPGILDPIFSMEDASSKISKIENAILKTDVEISSLTAQSGDDMLSFEILNTGDEKLWDFDNFDLIITYDADIGGIKTRVTEELSYNDVSVGLQQDFNIQRGYVDFVTTEDSATVNITPVRSYGEGGYSFVRVTNTQHAAAGPVGINNRNQDDAGVIAEITADDTITFTRQGSGVNEAFRVAYEVWEYVGPPGGPNEFIVRLNASPQTTDSTPVDTLIPNVDDQERLVPFIIGMLSTDGDDDWDELTHTAEINHFGSGETYVRIENDGDQADAASIKLVVVEFTGSNWIIQNNISHQLTASGANQAETVAGNANFTQNVNSWNEAFIVDSFHSENGEEQARDTGYLIWPDATTDSILFRVHANAGNVGALFDYLTIAHLVENPDMTVTHVDSITGGAGALINGGTDPDVQNKGFAPAVASTSETGVIAMATTNIANDTPNRGTWNYNLTSTNNVQFYRGANGAGGNFAMQIIEFPQLDSPLAASLWSVFNIKNDYIDSNILNPGETAQITAQIQNNIFQDGIVIIQIVTDNGVQSSRSKVIS